MVTLSVHNNEPFLAKQINRNLAEIIALKQEVAKLNSTVEVLNTTLNIILEVVNREHRVNRRRK